MKVKYKSKFALLLIVFTVLFCSACDHTNLTGTLHVLSDDLTSNTKIPLLLELPDELLDIHDVMWGVFYEDATNIDDRYIMYGDLLKETYSEDELNVLYGTTDINYERIALFLPTKPGSYHIIVDGFYKQTNPQPITETKIIIE